MPPPQAEQIVLNSNQKLKGRLFLLESQHFFFGPLRISTVMVWYRLWFDLSLFFFFLFSFHNQVLIFPVKNPNFSDQSLRFVFEDFKVNSLFFSHFRNKILSVEQKEVVRSSLSPFLKV